MCNESETLHFLNGRSIIVSPQIIKQTYRTLLTSYRYISFSQSLTSFDTYFFLTHRYQYRGGTHMLHMVDKPSPMMEWGLYDHAHPRTAMQQPATPPREKPLRITALNMPAEPTWQFCIQKPQQETSLIQISARQ